MASPSLIICSLLTNPTSNHSHSWVCIAQYSTTTNSPFISLYPKTWPLLTIAHLCMECLSHERTSQTLQCLSQDIVVVKPVSRFSPTLQHILRNTIAKKTTTTFTNLGGILRNGEATTIATSIVSPGHARHVTKVEVAQEVVPSGSNVWLEAARQS